MSQPKKKPPLIAPLSTLPPERMLSSVEECKRDLFVCMAFSSFISAMEKNLKELFQSEYKKESEKPFPNLSVMYQLPLHYYKIGKGEETSIIPSYIHPLNMKIIPNISQQLASFINKLYYSIIGSLDNVHNLQNKNLSIIKIKWVEDNNIRTKLIPTITPEETKRVQDYINGLLSFDRMLKSAKNIKLITERDAMLYLNKLKGFANKGETSGGYDIHSEIYMRFPSRNLIRVNYSTNTRKVSLDVDEEAFKAYIGIRYTNHIILFPELYINNKYKYTFAIFLQPKDSTYTLELFDPYHSETEQTNDTMYADILAKLHTFFFSLSDPAIKITSPSISHIPRFYMSQTQEYGFELDNNYSILYAVMYIELYLLMKVESFGDENEMPNRENFLYTLKGIQEEMATLPFRDKPTVMMGRKMSDLALDYNTHIKKSIDRIIVRNKVILTSSDPFFEDMIQFLPPQIDSLSTFVHREPSPSSSERRNTTRRENVGTNSGTNQEQGIRQRRGFFFRRNRYREVEIQPPPRGRTEPPPPYTPLPEPPSYEKATAGPSTPS